MMRFIATWFYIGLLKPAPGTWGSLGALPFIYIFLIIELNVLYLLIISTLVFILGWLATLIETKEKSEHDPSEIVIDEVVGTVDYIYTTVYYYIKRKISHFNI
jgi:phosphatidylglycerophosphatase A